MYSLAFVMMSLAVCRQYSCNTISSCPSRLQSRGVIITVSCRTGTYRRLLSTVRYIRACSTRPHTARNQNLSISSFTTFVPLDAVLESVERPPCRDPPHVMQGLEAGARNSRFGGESKGFSHSTSVQLVSLMI